MTTKSDYMLLFRGTNWSKELSPEQIQKVASDWMAWFERLTKEGKVTSGHPLMNEGKIVSGRKGRSVADGPFADSKEAVGGYIYLQVTSEAEAIAIAQQCPGLEYGCVVEVRPVAEQCGLVERAAADAGRIREPAAATATAPAMS